MKYAFNTWAYSSFPSWLPAYPLADTITRLSKIGYDGVEIGCAAPHAWPGYLTESDRSNVRALLEGEGVTLVSMLPAPGGGPGFNPASPVEAERRATVDHYHEVIDLAADLGAGMVLYIGGWQVHGSTRLDAWSRSVACLDAVASLAADRGLVVAVEPTPADSNLVESADDALELMAAVGHPNVKVMFDTFHAHYRNEISADYVPAMGEALVHVHLSDSDRLPPGDGSLDFLSLMRALKAAGFDGYATMEIGFTNRNVDPDVYARRALHYLKGLEEQL